MVDLANRVGRRSRRIGSVYRSVSDGWAEIALESRRVLSGAPYTEVAYGMQSNPIMDVGTACLSVPVTSSFDSVRN